MLLMGRPFISVSAAAAVLAGAAPSLREAASAVAQVHLGLASDRVGCANGVSVSFASDVAAPYTVTLSSNGESVVAAQSTFSTYSVDEPEYNYSYTSPQLHTALLCGLNSSTAYAYTIGDDDNDAFTASFVSPPHAGDDGVETVVGVVGDPGDTTNSNNTLSQFAKPFRDRRVQAVLIAGDFSYANGEHRQWDLWMDEQQFLASAVPITGINGNHETITTGAHLNAPSYAAGQRLRVEKNLAYLARVFTPLSPASRAARRTWFSLDIRLIHFVFLDDYAGTNGTDASVVGSAFWLAEREAQLAWAERDLAAVDRNVTPWVVAVKHNPYYNTWGVHQCQCSSALFEIADADTCWRGQYVAGSPLSEPHCALQAKMEDVYAAYGVNIVMAGHVHGYERTAKVYRNKVDDAQGTYYVTTGAGGNYEGHAGPRLAEKCIPAWSISGNNVVYGGSRLVATRTKLQAVWFANDFLHENEAVATDGFTIYANGPDDLHWPPTIRKRA